MKLWTVFVDTQNFGNVIFAELEIDEIKRLGKWTNHYRKQQQYGDVFLQLVLNFVANITLKKIEIYDLAQKNLQLIRFVR